MWNKKYKECICCGTTTTKHKGHGLCVSCWHRDWRKKNPIKIKAIRDREYLKNRDRYLEYQKKYQSKNKKRLLKYWSNYHRNKSFGGKYEKVLKRDNYKCMLCKSKNMLIIHHIDKNIANNTEKNLVVLCRRCHPKIHYSKDRMKIESDLHRNMQRQAEMTCPPSNRE